MGDKNLKVVFAFEKENPESMNAPVLKGGKGSGHHGHKGIPGHQGGSLPEGAAGNAGEALNAILGEELANTPRAPMPDTTPVGNVKPGGKQLTMDELQKQMDRHNERVVTEGVQISSYNGRTGRSSWYRQTNRFDQTVSFNTPEEADIWMNEIHGQLSDGKYEHRWNKDTYLPYLYKVKVDRSKPTTFPKQHYGDPHLSFTDLAFVFEGDTYEARGRYTQKDARAILAKISKAYRASYSDY
jgi:hypothetical protein